MFDKLISFMTGSLINARVQVQFTAWNADGFTSSSNRKWTNLLGNIKNRLHPYGSIQVYVQLDLPRRKADSQSESGCSHKSEGKD